MSVPGPGGALGGVLCGSGVCTCTDSRTPLPFSSSPPCPASQQDPGSFENGCAILKIWIASIFCVVVSRLKKPSICLEQLGKPHVMWDRERAL